MSSRHSTSTSHASSGLNPVLTSYLAFTRTLLRAITSANSKNRYPRGRLLPSTMGALALGRSCGGDQAGKNDVKPSEFAIQQCEGSISETVFGCRCSPDWLCGLPGTVHMTAVGVILERDAPQLCQRTGPRHLRSCQTRKGQNTYGGECHVSCYRGPGSGNPS
jgi:hypothetical protein